MQNAKCKINFQLSTFNFALLAPNAPNALNALAHPLRLGIVFNTRGYGGGQ